MEDNTNRGIITAIVVILILILIVWFWPRRLAYVEPTVIRQQTASAIDPGTSDNGSVYQTGRTTTTTTTTYPGTTDYYYEHSSSGNSAVCTMEAMRCPDGSYVGRSGPSCSFAPCP